MTRVLPIAAGILLVAAFGGAEGVWTHRWQPSRAPEEAAARLARVPLTVGEWQGEDQTLDARVVAKAELSGYVMRRYVHRPTGAAVSVLLVCGRPGPVSVHTPDVCYGGAGFALAAPPAHHTVTPPADPLRGYPAGPASFWVGRFEKSGAAVSERLRILWAWNAAGDWAAPDNPRLTFAAAPALYKLYVVRSVADLNEPLDDDPAVTFLRQFLPAVETCLFPAAAE
jgi:hypothetical protein